MSGRWFFAVVVVPLLVLIAAPQLWLARLPAPQHPDTTAERTRLEQDIARLRAELAARHHLPERPDVAVEAPDVHVETPRPLAVAAPRPVEPPATAVPPPQALPVAGPATPAPTPAVVPAPPLEPGVDIGIDLPGDDPRDVLAWTANGRLRRSAGGGETWRTLRGPSAIRLQPRLLRADGSWFIGAASTGSGVGEAVGLLSRDRGTSWQELRAPWPDTTRDAGLADDAAVLTAQGQVVLAQQVPGSPHTVRFWTSADRGATWTSEPPQADFHSLVVVANGALALFKRSDAELEMSLDRGRTRRTQRNTVDAFTVRPVRWDGWSAGTLMVDPGHMGKLSVLLPSGSVSTTLLPGFPTLFDQRMRPLATSFGRDPRKGSIWFAAVPRFGLLRSDNDGREWYAWDRDVRITALVIRRCGAQVWLAATGADTVLLDISEEIPTWRHFRTSLEDAQARAGTPR